MNTKNLRRNSRKCMRYIVVLFCKLLCATCCSMNWGRTRRSEPGRMGGRSSKWVGSGISRWELHNHAQYFAIKWRCRSQECKVRTMEVWNLFPSCIKYPCVDFITGIYGKTPKFILPRTVTRGHQQGWTRQIWGTRKPDLRSVLHLFVCTPLQAQPVSMWSWREISNL